MIFNKFQTIVILSPTMKERDVDSFKTYYTNLFNKWGSPVEDNISGHLTEVKDIGKKKLPYTIAGHNEGYYIQFTYWSEEKNISDLERRFREDPDIIKFITIKQTDNDGNAYALLSDKDFKNPFDDIESEQISSPGQNNYNYLFGYTNKLNK